MKAKQIVLGATVVVAVGLIGFAAGVSVGQEKKTRIYELRTYTVLPGRLPALHKRFAEHTMKLFEKQGMRNEMYILSRVECDEKGRDRVPACAARWQRSTATRMMPGDA